MLRDSIEKNHGIQRLATPRKLMVKDLMNDLERDDATKKRMLEQLGMKFVAPPLRDPDDIMNQNSYGAQTIRMDGRWVTTSTVISTFTPFPYGR